MNFKQDELAAAARLRQLGLPWTPKVGQYVFDQTRSCDRDSPFQEGVIFILNHSHFMKLIGGIDRFKELMIWLPTWEDLRDILRDLGVSASEVTHCLLERNAIDLGTERLVLYELIESKLKD